MQVTSPHSYVNSKMMGNLLGANPIFASQPPFPFNWLACVSLTCIPSTSSPLCFASDSLRSIAPLASTSPSMSISHCLNVPPPPPPPSFSLWPHCLASLGHFLHDFCEFLQHRRQRYGQRGLTVEKQSDDWFHRRCEVRCRCIGWASVLCEVGQGIPTLSCGLISRAHSTTAC